MTQPVVFISYSHRDEAEKNELIAHLGVLQQAGLIDLWSDDRIRAGADWQAEMGQAISRAKIAVLLVTANFLNSDFILRMEVPELLRRHQEDGLFVLPILARACAWRAVPWLRQMSVRPQNRVPVWSDGGLHVDERLCEIAEEISEEITVKMTALTAPASPVQQSQSPQKQSEVWRVLAIDDEPNWQKRLKRILQEINCTVVTASSYDQAVHLLNTGSFDLVTIDLNLDTSTHYSDGFELVPRIKETFRHTPIIVVTGTGDLDDQRRAFKEYNVFDFIQKSKLDFSEFQEIVLEAIGSTRHLIQPQAHHWEDPPI
jgi:CheY-like chemotaxis protein